jgi:hypothetical protein
LPAELPPRPIGRASTSPLACISLIGDTVDLRPYSGNQVPIPRSNALR